MFRRRSQCLALGAAVIVAQVGSAQAITLRWGPVHLERVPPTHDDSVAFYNSPMVVLGDRRGAAVIRYTVDNPCGDKVRLRVRSRIAQTLEIQPVPSADLYGRGCPGVIELETYTGALTELRPGRWRVARHSLLRYPIADFSVR